MKCLVLTIAIGQEYTQIARLTHPSIQAYTLRIGADFLCLDHTGLADTTPHWEKFQIAPLLDHYERILYLDTDLIVRDDCPDIFQLVPPTHLGMFNEAQFTERSKEMMIDICKAYGITLAGWDGRYFNSGVMVISQRHQELFRKPEQEICNFYEQSYLNMMIAAMQPEMFELPYQLNRMSCMDQVTGEHRLASYIVHYAGCPNPSILPELIQQDLEKLASMRGDYRFKRHIHVLATGGLGDQVNAEPAIRFMRQRVYPDDSITVSTHHPALFTHLRAQAINIYEHGSFVPEPDTPYYTINSLPPPTSIHWSILSNLLCHTVDYCSTALLRRILPVESKSVHLSVHVDAESKLKALVPDVHLNELVLIHAGRHWETKTFPLQWWQNVVNGLDREGLKVCLIGKNDDEPEDKRGYVPVVCPPHGLDLRDKLSLEQLIALVSIAPVLVSNDSSPIHIAGAFDNWIVLIPSCKHPEHVLPHRHGSTRYKAMALYKRLTLDEISSQPTDVHGVSADFDVEDWSQYLPEPQEIIEKVSSIKETII